MLDIHTKVHKLLFLCMHVRHTTQLVTHSECQLVFCSITEFQNGGNIPEVFIMELHEIHIKVVAIFLQAIFMNRESMHAQIEMILATGILLNILAQGPIILLKGNGSIILINLFALCLVPHQLTL